MKLPENPPESRVKVKQSDSKSVKIQPSIEIILSGKNMLDKDLILLVESIPYHSWGWAINMSWLELIEWIKWANFETIRAICYRFVMQDEPYWNDNRERNFDGIIDAIEWRLRELWYSITKRRDYHYLQNSGKRRISIPVNFDKIEENTTL
jgi:hypothetical protein